MHRLFPILKTLSTVVLFLGLLLLTGPCFALESLARPQESSVKSLDKLQLLTQQIAFLKKRADQAEKEWEYLRQQQEKGLISFEDDQANEFLLYKTRLHYAGTQSTLDSINIELTDSQQALVLQEKNIQEINNQLNALHIFGLKQLQGDAQQSQSLHAELQYQESLYPLEKQRLARLLALQKQEKAILQRYNEIYTQVNAFLKSRKMLHLKEREVQYERRFMAQQDAWLQRLEGLYEQVKDRDAHSSKGQYAQLENEIFYVNENIHLLYLKTLVARYQDQLRQLRLSIARTNSISLLNSLSDQTQILGRQIARVEKLLAERVGLVKKHQALEAREKQDLLLVAQNTESKTGAPGGQAVDSLAGLMQQYAVVRTSTAHLNKHLADFRLLLDRSIQHELAARQGLPGFSTHAWLNLGKEGLLMPILSFQRITGFFSALWRALQDCEGVELFLLLAFEAAAVLASIYFRKKLHVFLQRMTEGFGLIFNSKQLLGALLLRNLLPLALLANASLLFYVLGLPSGQYEWLMDLSAVWLIFRAALIVARMALLETVSAVNDGHDARLYHRLKVLLVCGAVLTSVTVFLHHLPLIYELQDLFDRLFLLLLLIFSLLILRSWRVLPQLILQYTDSQGVYLRRAIYFLGIFIPSLLFLNALMGLFGFVNLVGMIAWYEGVFTLVLVTYFLLRAGLSDFMEFLSQLMIQHVSNGWLWTEAFLKPLHQLFRVFLFFGAWMLLFLFYGWNPQSPMVERLTKLLHYPVIAVLNTTITPLSMLEVLFAIFLFYWAARWTREFVYRLLFSKCRDLGIRTSIAILSQYAVVVIGILLCLRLLGIDLHALFLVASGLLIAISFGLRDLVNNFACGLILLFERPIRVRDIVCVDGQEGEVTHIGSRAVTVRTWDHMEIIVPNTELFNKSFINWTVHDDIVRTVISLKIDRKDSPFKVQELIHAVLKGLPEVLRDPVPEVFLKDMVQNHSEFEIRYFVNVRQVLSRVSVRSTVLLALWRSFEEHGIKVPHVQHEILMKGPLPLLPAP